MCSLNAMGSSSSQRRQKHRIIGDIALLCAFVDIATKLSFLTMKFRFDNNLDGEVDERPISERIDEIFGGNPRHFSRLKIDDGCD